MSSAAEDLLNTLDVNDTSLLPVTTAARAAASEKSHIVIGEDRYITVPEELKRIAVQYDHNMETVTFDCPRYWDELDMSQMIVYINYMRADNKPGSYTAQNIKVDEHDETIMHFDWTILRHVTEAKGSLKFLVCIKTKDEEGNEENHWNSELNNEMYISEGLEFEEIVEELYPDTIIQVETNTTDISDLKTKTDNTNTQVETNKTDISGLKTKTDNTNAQVETNKTDISGLKTSVEGLSTQAETNKTDISELSQRVTSAETAVRQLSSEQVAALNNMFAICTFTEDSVTAYAAFKTAFGITE